MKRGNENPIGVGMLRSPGLACVMHRHRHQQPKAARLPGAGRVALAEMDAIRAPAPGNVRPPCEQHGQFPCPRNAHQPSQQAPTGPLCKSVMAQNDAAARRQQHCQIRDSGRQPFVAEQPLVGQSERQGVASDHRPFYRRVAGTRNAPNRTR